jgi:hypothetical protein
MRLGFGTMRHFHMMLEWSLLLSAGFFALSFIWVAFNSMTFPFPLEWMEGQSIDVIGRILDGKPLYTAPSVEYVPLIYPPYYYYVSALVAYFTGLDFFPARLVATLATLGCAAMIYLWLRKENADWKMSLVGACLFLATYRISGRWFDMARVDSLFLLLTLAGLYVLVYGRGMANAFCASALLCFAFFTKQTALMIAAPVFAAMLFINWYHALTAGGMLAVMVGLGVLVLNYVSDGWFNFYIFTLPAAHDFDRTMWWRFWSGDIFGHVGIFFLMMLAIIAYIFYHDRRKGLLYLGLAAGFVGASYMSRLHSFGYINVLMPLHAFLTLAVGVSLGMVMRFRNTHRWLAGAAMLVMIELSTLMYSPTRQIPDDAALAGGNRFLEQLSAYPGEVLMPEIQFIQTRIGKPSHALGMAAFDLMRSDLGEKNYIKQEFHKQLKDAVASGRFSAVIPGRIFRVPALDQHYARERDLDYMPRFVGGAIGMQSTAIYRPLRQRAP